MTTEPSIIPSALNQKQLLEKYVSAVMHAPASLGLTAAKCEREFWERHVLDALELLAALPKKDHERQLQVIDVGSGNGIPGIPVAIALPDWHVALLDSNNRKCGFLDMFCKFNSIQNVSVIVGRAEIIAHEPDQRSRYDAAFGRALGKLPVALELCAAFVKSGGTLLMPQGHDYRPILQSSENAMKELGLSLIKIKPYSIHQTMFTNLLFKKDHETPERYPRKPGIPKKRPL